MDKVSTDIALPRIKSASPDRTALTLKVEWVDGRKSKIDLTGLVHSSRHFHVFTEDQEAFRTMKVDEFGTGVEWDNGLDYSAANLARMAEEQRLVTGKDFRGFTTRFKLNTEEVAALLDVSTKTVRNYEHATALPRTVGIALRRFEQDPTVFAALYRPVKVRPRGRPRQAS